MEDIVKDLGLAYEMRGRFVGRNRDTGPAHLAIPSFAHAKIAIGCKGFDSTGSKLTAAVQEMADMAQVRFADQYIYGIVDGIGCGSVGKVTSDASTSSSKRVALTACTRSTTWTGSAPT